MKIVTCRVEMMRNNPCDIVHISIWNKHATCFTLLSVFCCFDTAAGCEFGL